MVRCVHLAGETGAVRTAPLALGCLFAVLALAGCGTTSSAGRACSPITREALDPGSIQHVLPGAQPHYLTDPPTSGAHQPSPPVAGVQTKPIGRPVQVGILEQGHIVVQYRGVSAADVAALRTLVGPRVVVAPAASLPAGQRVVATAWLYKQVCRAVDLPTLRRFIAARAGKGPT